MRALRPKFDRCTYTSRTTSSLRWVQDTLKRADLFRTDPDKKERLKLSLCLPCFYMSGRVGGAAITYVRCALCGKDMMFGSTCVDVFCPDCAANNDLCRHCGGDVNLKIRRRELPTPVTIEDSPSLHCQ